MSQPEAPGSHSAPRHGKPLPGAFAIEAQGPLACASSPSSCPPHTQDLSGQDVTSPHETVLRMDRPGSGRPGSRPGSGRPGSGTPRLGTGTPRGPGSRPGSGSPRLGTPDAGLLHRRESRLSHRSLTAQSRDSGDEFDEEDLDSGVQMQACAHAWLCP